MVFGLLSHGRSESFGRRVFLARLIVAGYLLAFSGVITERRLPIKYNTMLSWAVVFFVLAIIAAMFGFGGIAVAATGIAKILFYIFVVLFVITLIMRLA